MPRHPEQSAAGASDVRRAVAMGGGMVLTVVAMALLVAPVLRDESATAPVPVLVEHSVRMADPPPPRRDRPGRAERRPADRGAPEGTALDRTAPAGVIVPAGTATRGDEGSRGRDGTVVLVSAARGGIPAPTGFKADDDGDGLPTYWEESFGSDPDVADAVADLDADGLTNVTEFQAHSLPRESDTNRDGTPDAADDPDGDGATNWEEQEAQTDPAVAEPEPVPDPIAEPAPDPAPIIEPDPAPEPEESPDDSGPPGGDQAPAAAPAGDQATAAPPPAAPPPEPAT